MEQHERHEMRVLTVGPGVALEQNTQEFAKTSKLKENWKSKLKVGVNHGFFHIYHFWHFLIFKCTWVCSSSSSKNKNIFLNLFINSINLKMSIYLSISKMCLSLFSRGNQACARIANAKRTTQSRDAELSAVYIEGTRLTFELARWPWQPVRSFENNSEIHDICWGIMNTYFLISWILPSGFWGNLR